MLSGNGDGNRSAPLDVEPTKGMVIMAPGIPGGWEFDQRPPMKRSDVPCPDCSAGYRRIELQSPPGTQGVFRCTVCDRVLEVFDGTKEVAYRLTVQPSIKALNDS
ncbi:MAG: hypothetical protein JO051_00125 [Acidobacteriaceae bacterium]|nr:hypothetical protein [Acidobacteriaceae bacterium]